MISHRTTVLLGLAALLFGSWLGGPARADCDDPLGGSTCQNQDLDSNDDPGGSECNGDLVVASASSSGSTLSVGLSNPAVNAEEGFVVVTVLLEGEKLTFAAPVSVEGRSGLTVQFIFPGTITLVSAEVCSNRPGGINEGPDVVAVKQEEEPTE